MVNIPIIAYAGTEPYIFISYSHMNKQIVYDIIERLDQEEYRIWYDEGIEPGASFAKEIFNRINNCHTFIVFISPESLGSKHVINEIGIAFEERKTMIPIILDENIILPEEVRYFLGSIQHATKMTDNQELFFDRIINAISDEVKNNIKIENDILIKCKENSKHVTIPDHISIIGCSAFKNCTSLESIILNDNLRSIQDEAFRNCTNLKKILIPGSVTEIGSSVFRDCIKLEEVIIANSPNQYIEIGERAFENCTSLKRVVLPDCLTELYGGIFNSCRALESIDIPSNVTIIGENAFFDCINLCQIVLPENLTKIDDYAFAGCTGLSTVTIPDGTTKIGKNSFRDCTSLNRIYIPKNVFKIGFNPFQGCRNLESIEVNKSNKFFKSVDNVLFNKNKSILICCPAKKIADEYSVPDSVTDIWSWAFCNCKDIMKIIIPDCVLEIGEGAFFDCTALEFIEIPDSVTKIDDVAFRDCKNLKVITFNDSLKELGWGLFNGCNEELTVHCPKDSMIEYYCRKKNIRLTND